MSAVEDRLAAIAADHAPDQISPDDGYSWVDGCTCGWMGTESPNWDAQEWAGMDAPEYRTYRLWAEHLAAVVASSDDLAVIEIPVVAHKAVGVTDAEVFAGAAWRIEEGYAPGGSNTTAAVVELLRRVVKAAEGVSDRA